MYVPEESVIDARDEQIRQQTELIEQQAETFSQTGRSKQLEYSFRRGLMRRYENFAVCTRHALEYCCAEYEVSFSVGQKNALLQSYRALPAFGDVKESLVGLKAEGHRRSIGEFPTAVWLRNNCRDAKPGLPQR